jgi:hypothetical protein
VPGAIKALKANQHKVRSGKRDNPKIACAQAWPYYDEGVRSTDATGDDDSRSCVSEHAAVASVKMPIAVQVMIVCKLGERETKLTIRPLPATISSIPRGLRKSPRQSRSVVIVTSLHQLILRLRSSRRNHAVCRQSYLTKQSRPAIGLRATPRILWLRSSIQPLAWWSTTQTSTTGPASFVPTVMLRASSNVRADIWLVMARLGCVLGAGFTNATAARRVLSRDQSRRSRLASILSVLNPRPRLLSKIAKARTGQRH